MIRGGLRGLPSLVGGNQGLARPGRCVLYTVNMVFSMSYEHVAKAVDLPFLLTADEAAALLRTTRKAVYAMADRGQLAGVTRLGRRLLIRRDDLLRSLSEVVRHHCQEDQ